MKNHNTFIKKALSVFLSVVMVFCMLPTIAITASAATGNIKKISDPATVNDWKVFFGPDATDTTWAGSVWTDKSVFTNVADYIAATDESDDNIDLEIDSNNFLVALSAIASSKSVEGYSTLPTDTVLVLDLSGSMQNNSSIAPMVTAANAAIKTLLELNANNRVGVVAYSGNTNTGDSTTATATVILPLGRYTAGLDNSNNSAFLVSSWRQNNQNRNGVKVANGVTATTAVSGFSTNNSKVAGGGTYIQNGIYKAWQQFEAVTDTVVPDGPQAGVIRTPVMVLMSDGDPTAATTSYTNINTSNIGKGSTGSAGKSFLTQLTASWARDKMEQKYNNGSLVYTLGLNVSDNANALNLLDPANNTGSDTYWANFKALQNTNQYISVTTDTGSANVYYTQPVDAAKGWNENYVDKYFAASNSAGLINAFNDIVQQIIIQSLYYPTLVSSGGSINHDGFIYFEDIIGKNMEVKAVKGIQLGNKLYDGHTIAKMIYEGGMGTVQNPTDAGNNLVWSVQSRLGIDDVQTARQLINYAYNEGQLYYNPETGEYSNYIGWYADANGKYVGFWDGKDDTAAAVPNNLQNVAVYANKSYGYYDAVGEGHRLTDMMYATIMVRTTLKDNTNTKEGDISVIGKLPASLIPLVEYNVKLDGTDPMKPTELIISGDTAPSRLIYEVGLDSDIDLLNIEATAPETLEKDADGNYIFYTNQYNKDPNYTYTYNTNKNTITYFEPSVENERYYYNIDSLIFTDENGTLYQGANPPQYNVNLPLYHRNLIYKISGGSVVAEWHYEQVSQYALNDLNDLGQNSDNTWYVKRGTIHHYFADYEMEKEENTTGTFAYSDKPFVHEPNDGREIEYHIDSYLGNNGLLTFEPYEGIKITKTADATITDKTEEYTFTLTTENTFNETLTYIAEDVNGNRLSSTVTFNSGVATITLKHGEAAYILGENMIGKTFTVSENIPDGAEYRVYSVNGNEEAKTANIAVEENAITTADFVNTIPQIGDVVITKVVVSELQDHNNKDFTFTVTLSGGGINSGDTFDLADSTGVIGTVVAGQNNTVTLKNAGAITIKDLPDGATVTVTESDYSGVGFTANAQTLTATAVKGEVHYINFINTYSAEATDQFDIEIPVIKHLTDNQGNPVIWNGGQLDFKFQLQEYKNGAYQNVGDVVTATYQNNATTTATINLNDVVYPAPGNYYYRVIEVEDSANIAKGIVYDTIYERFYVTVVDNANGKLVVDSITPLGDATVNQNTVTVEFNNIYEVSGAAEAVIDINKIMANAYGQNANVLPAGFSFSLYESNAQYNTIGNKVATSPTTGASGATRISVLYDDIGQDAGIHYYVLKEDAGSASGVSYTDKQYNVFVEVTDINGNFKITVKLFGENGLIAEKTVTANANNLVAVAEVSGAEFENIFTPTPVTQFPPVGGTKVLVGKDLSANAFSFTLYKTESNFETANAEVIDTAEVNAAGYYRFDDFTYDKEGIYYYVVKENVPNDAVNNKHKGITYDQTEYKITVTVTGDAVTGALTANYSIENGAVINQLNFNNVYNAQPVSTEITGTKHLLGDIRKLQANAFEFELVENGVVVQTVRNLAPTTDYDAPFRFELNYNAVGEHTYTVREKVPLGIDANNTYHGVVYDLSQYTVKVTVYDNGVGNLVAAVDYINGNIAFENAYNVTPVAATISGKKNLAGDSISKHTFTFELYEANFIFGENRIEQGAYITNATNDTNGNFEFANIPALSFDKIGGYRFIIKEVKDANADELMVYDTASYFVEIDVTDNLFGELQTSTKITKITDEGMLTIGSIEFNNTYNVEPIRVDLGGIKNFNKTLTDGMFTFELYQALSDGTNITAVGEPVLTAQNGVDGSFTFEEAVLTDEATGQPVVTQYLTFNHAGEYYFVVKEKIPDGVDADNRLNGITYDTNEYAVTVVITENIDSTGRAVLTESVLINNLATGEIVFNNNYTANSTTATITGQKTLEGKDLEANEFDFVLYDKDGAEIDVVQNGADGKIEFAPIIFEQEGEYTFTVKEDSSPNAKGITYDQTIYTVTVNVTDNGLGALEAEVIYAVGQDQVQEIEFVNQFTPEPEPQIPPMPSSPKTGDLSNVFAWAALMFISGGLVAVTSILGKKKKAN